MMQQYFTTTFRLPSHKKHLQKVLFDLENVSKFLYLIREPILKSIISNPENGSAITEITLKAIKIEKKLGVFNIDD